MNEKDFNKVIEFYENVIKQQIIKPLEINEIYSIIHPEVENPQGMAYKLKQRAISVFVGTRKAIVMKSFDDFLKSFDTTDISIPNNPSIHIENPSHEESFADTQEVTQVLDNETPHRSDSDTQEVTDAEVQIALLEAEYENANDANEKRSLKTKIRHLKNKANG